MSIDLDALVGPAPLGPNDIFYLPIERPLVQAVDALIEYAKSKGFSKTVETEAHWEVLERIANVWASLYPKEYADFKQFATKQKANSNKMAVSREGEAMVQHQLEIPRKLHDLILAIYPLQKFDKKFVSKFSRRFPAMKMTEGSL